MPHLGEVAQISHLEGDLHREQLLLGLYTRRDRRSLCFTIKPVPRSLCFTLKPVPPASGGPGAMSGARPGNESHKADSEAESECLMT